MNHAKTLVSLVFAGLLATGCSNYGTKKVAGPEDYKQAVENAKLALDNAKKMHYEWRDSRKILKKAGQAAKSATITKPPNSQTKLSVKVNLL